MFCDNEVKLDDGTVVTVYINDVPVGNIVIQENSGKALFDYNNDGPSLKIKQGDEITVRTKEGETFLQGNF